MAKQRRLLPARKQRDQAQVEGSILLRSAESIGRVIGTLQRQLDGARGRLAGIGDTKDGNNNRGAHKVTPTHKTGKTRKATPAAGSKKSTTTPRATSSRKTTARRTKTTAGRTRRSR